MSNPVIGFIGLGIMGKPWSNPAKGGHLAPVSHRTQRRLARIRPLGSYAKPDRENGQSMIVRWEKENPLHHSFESWMHKTDSR